MDVFDIELDSRMGAITAIVLYGLPLLAIITAHTTGMVSLGVYGVFGVASIVAYIKLSSLYKEILTPAAHPSAPALPPAPEENPDVEE